MSHLKKTSGRC